ncbi:Killer toxin, Kp4/SMK-like, core [Metarhizium album ARSEF 1941]|uniref:Killer toxin, Kp4/SMK-like, core n=1 Tax=Metarhizium album (strain ARSEF 1941) TaxID=1081103 RepID=A0A0B2WXP4_METAS|nr:Killer toxin, Kp4/SMK-like, core [Metarhizium album ARSEF 1941]KHN97635.1 Killer toxin, Kp4/SMK-like, core [Metarhizium album ARSEF 1941]
MHISLLPVLFVSGAAALGINCRGSGVCFFNDASLQAVHNQVGNMIAAGGGNRYYWDGGKRAVVPRGALQIACSQGSQGSVCAFYQNGASGYAWDAYAQIQGLLDHGCRQCGSIPTLPGNDVNTGELTVNYVRNPCCLGDCYC